MDYFATNLKARALYRLKRFEEALQVSEAAIKIEPRFAPAYVTHALVEFELRDYYQTLVDCDEAIKLNPSENIAYQVRGLVHLQAGQIDKSELDKAIADFNKAIELAPNEPEAYYHRGLAYKMKGEKTKALSDLNAVITLSKDLVLIKMAEELIVEINNSD